MIGLERINKLITGEIDPETLGEEVFVNAYEAAISGVLLFSYLIEAKPPLNELTDDELHYIIMGYSMGQKTLEDAESELIENDQTFH